MTVDGLQSVVVTDDDILTITLAGTFVPDDTYFTTEGSTDGITNINLDVEAFVLAAPAGTKV